MDLKPIPEEVKQILLSKTKIHEIRKRLKEKEDIKSDKILQKTCIKMSEYIILKGKINGKELDDLINNMYRSLISLHKKKQEIQKKRKR